MMQERGTTVESLEMMQVGSGLVKGPDDPVL